LNQKNKNLNNWIIKLNWSKNKKLLTLLKAISFKIKQKINYKISFELNDRIKLGFFMNFDWNQENANL
jgi:hypothetical protein